MERPRDLAAWAVLLPHVLAVADGTAEPHQVPWLVTQAADYIQTQGAPGRHAPVRMRPGPDRERLGEDHPDTLAAAHNLASALARARQARRHPQPQPGHFVMTFADVPRPTGTSS